MITAVSVDAAPVPSLHAVSLMGPRLVLREVEPADALAAFQWGSDPGWFEYSLFDPVATLEEEHAFIAGVIETAKAVPRIHYHLAVVRAAGTEMIGLAHLKVDGRHRSGALGYGIRRDLWGCGYGTEAATLLVDFGFGRLGLHRIWATHHPDSVGSGRILQRLGMQHEGRLRDDAFAHGQWRDSIVYSILENEWTPSAIPT
jgi:RimJ/RimL family protein N-acetyltransferase